MDDRVSDSVMTTLFAVYVTDLVVDWCKAWLRGWLNLVCRSLIDEAEGEIGSNVIFLHDYQLGMCQAMKEHMLEINHQFWCVKRRIW